MNDLLDFQDKKRILIISQYFWPESFKINDLAESLVSKGHEVTVLTGKPNYPSGSIFEGYTFGGILREDFHGVKVVRVPLVPRGGSSSLMLMINYLSFVFFTVFFGLFSLRKYSFDLIFVFQTSPITVCIPAIILKKIKKTPIFMWVQDLWPESLKAVGAIKSDAILSLVNQLVKNIYKNCDLLLVQSKGFIKDIQGRGVPESKIQYFPNWAEEIFEDKASIDQDVPDLSGNFKVVFAGNLGEAQGFNTILDAFKKLENYPDIHLNIIGDGRKKKWIENRIKELRLEQKIHLMGRFSVNSMPALFNKADALLVHLKKAPIFELTIPSKVQAYLAVGKPIIAGLSGEGGRIIKEAGAGYVAESEDPKALSECVLRTYQLDNVERDTIGNNGRAYFLKNFKKSELIGQFLNIMNDKLLTK